MKNIIIIFAALILFSCIASGQDSTLVADKELRAMKQQTEKLKQFLIEDYLARKQQSLPDAFIDFYVDRREIEKQVRALLEQQRITARLVKDLQNVKTLAGLDSLKLKYKVE